MCKTRGSISVYRLHPKRHPFTWGSPCVLFVPAYLYTPASQPDNQLSNAPVQWQMTFIFLMFIEAYVGSSKVDPEGIHINFNRDLVCIRYIRKIRSISIVTCIYIVCIYGYIYSVRTNTNQMRHCAGCWAVERFWFSQSR